MKKYYRMTIESKAVPVMRAAVLAGPGQAARDLCKAHGYTYVHGIAVLTLLRKAGEITPVKSMGGAVQWWPADQAAEQAEKWIQARKDHTRKRKAINRRANPTSKDSRIQITSPAAVKVFQTVVENPGIQSTKMAELTGYKLSHVKNVLSIIRAAGLAVPIPGNGVCRHWYSQEVAGPKVEQWEATRRKRSEPKQRPPTKREKIEEFSRHDDGVRMSVMVAMLGIPQNIVSRHVVEMIRQKRIFRANRPGARMRWFDTAERAAAWEAMPAVFPSEWSEPRRKAWADNPRPPKPPKAKLVAIGQKIKSATRQPSKAPPLLAGSRARDPNAVIAAKPGKAATVTLHGKPSDMRGQVDYSKAKITIDATPKYDARYQVAPGAVVVGEFSRQWQQLRGAA